MLGDETLARRVNGGDRCAFSALYERYQAPLSRYCRSIVRDRDEAADAVQNTMLAALAGLERELPSGPLRPWLYRIAHNESIDLIRRRSRSREDLVAESPDLGDLDAAPEVTEQIRALFSDLGELPERQRGALLMRELAGLEYDQIGRVFGASTVAARKLVYEARVSLSAQREGRSTDCATVLRQLSDGDGRTARGRAIRAHLSGCDACAAFERSLRVRRDQLALIPALPLLGGGLWLAGTIGGGAGATKAIAAGGAVGVGAGATGGGVLSGSVVSGVSGAVAVKCLSVCGALAVVGAGAAIAGGGHQPAVRPANVVALHPAAGALGGAAGLHAPSLRHTGLAAAASRAASASTAARAGTGEPPAAGPADHLRPRTLAGLRLTSPGVAVIAPGGRGLHRARPVSASHTPSPSPSVASPSAAAPAASGNATTTPASAAGPATATPSASEGAASNASGAASSSPGAASSSPGAASSSPGAPDFPGGPSAVSTPDDSSGASTEGTDPAASAAASYYAELASSMVSSTAPGQVVSPSQMANTFSGMFGALLGQGQSTNSSN